MTESKVDVSRRGFVKYVLAAVATVIAVVTGIMLLGRRQIETPLPEGYADMILMNGKVLTVDSKDSVVEAVAVETVRYWQQDRMGD